MTTMYYQEAVLIVRNYRPSNSTYVFQGRNRDFFSGNHKGIKYDLNWPVCWLVLRDCLKTKARPLVLWLSHLWLRPCMYQAQRAAAIQQEGSSHSKINPNSSCLIILLVHRVGLRVHGSTFQDILTLLSLKMGSKQIWNCIFNCR